MDPCVYEDDGVIVYYFGSTDNNDSPC